MILTKQIRLDLTTTAFFVQINDYGKWEASLQISIKPQQIVLTFASRNGNTGRKNGFTRVAKLQ